MIRVPLKPPHPERVCWGCDKYCPADELTCGNGTERTPHPVELFGDDWQQWAASDNAPEAATASEASTATSNSPSDHRPMKHAEHPFIAIWETTQACDLVCQHCRACARPQRDPDELTTEEGFALLRQLRAGGVPLVVLTGGDPAKRPDLLELVRYGVSQGLHLGLTPSATPLVTNELVYQLSRAGLHRLAISLDGHTAEIHDAFRGVQGSFSDAVRILNAAKACGLRSQVNTTVHAGTIHRLRDVAALVDELGSVLWSVFYIVPTGRAEERMLPSAEAVEATLHELATIAATARFAVKTTAAPHYRRVLAQRKAEGAAAVQHGTFGKQGERVNDGRGFLFVSHRGEIFPSGFLPIPCGNVRSENPIDVYRDDPLFQRLRDATALTGKCGACEYRHLCGGSRARAYAMTGNALGSDPLCSYVPPGYDPERRPGPRRLEVVE
ncbi:MAG TPA: TIGR04053 family radical SAM/SPASM domain-containing protein [Polyangiaceae bacterium]|nr:TIGR04053 family radical SAM/SPASM domain-containing protein [Polyangiaceae bacterium]